MFLSKDKNKEKDIVDKSELFWSVKCSGQKNSGIYFGKPV